MTLFKADVNLFTTHLTLCYMDKLMKVAQDVAFDVKQTEHHNAPASCPGLIAPTLS